MPKIRGIVVREERGGRWSVNVEGKKVWVVGFFYEQRLNNLKKLNQTSCVYRQAQFDEIPADSEAWLMCLYPAEELSAQNAVGAHSLQTPCLGRENFSTMGNTLSSCALHAREL